MRCCDKKQRIQERINRQIKILIIQNNYNEKIMKKVNLSSQIYKIQNTKTPTKQKQHPELQPEQQKSPSNRQYQNICCPSCKYLFKVNKDYDRNKNTIYSNMDSKGSERYSWVNSNGNSNKNWYKNGTSANKQGRNVCNAQVQTQQYFMGNFKTSPKRENFGKGAEKGMSRYEQKNVRFNPYQDDDGKRAIMTDRTPQKSYYYDERLNKKMRSQFLTDRQLQPKKNQAGSELLTSRKKQSSNISNEKISNLIKKQKEKQKPQFPARSAYLNPKQFSNDQSVTPKKTLGNFSPTPPPRPSPAPLSSNHSKKVNESKSNLTAQQNMLAKQLLNKIQLTEQINQIIEYNLSLPQEMSVPSYCKMLLYEMKDRQQLKIQENMYDEIDKLESQAHFGETKPINTQRSSFNNGKPRQEPTNRILNY